MQNKLKREGTPNRLIREKSPYLLQHAYNPVDWQPWSKEAFEQAKAQNKPVFVSIGYSACHWCHVMEKECFNDEEVAKLMNKEFICVKVDREERPDIDNAYMAACHAMGRSCGWPLNVIMTPEKTPFFAASYIPKNSRFGLVGLIDLIPQISTIWRTRRTELETLGENIKHRIAALERRQPETELSEETLHSAYEQLEANFDAENGGFGHAPKFPMPHNLLFLIRYWNRTKQKTALEMAEKTLQAMRRGGIFDHIGFGFHRYSTDPQWLVPHFEKMLYDQALLAMAYTEAYQATGTEEYKQTAEEILEYALRDLTSPEGGFYSAEDADSEDEEGKFYLWTETEIRKNLPPEDADLAIKIFGIQNRGNHTEHGRTSKGKNILHLPKPLRQIASENNIPLDRLSHKLEKTRKMLFESRKTRVHPIKDDKVLTDWNGLMIAALAKAYQVFGKKEYLQAAEKAADFLLSQMKQENGKLYHRYAKGEKAVDGFLDDYAFLVWGLIEIHQANFKTGYLQEAHELSKTMIKQFLDEKNSGFYFTAENAEYFIHRKKETYDGALPSGNSVAMFNLLRLSRLVNEPTYEEAASRISKAFAGEVKTAPTAHTFLLLAADFAIGPGHTVNLVGEIDEENLQNMLVALRKKYLPTAVISLKKPSQESGGYTKINGKATAYICRGQTCMPPTNEPLKMLQLLEP
ncbi:MAG: thioredoxin domain-containing protein [Candidatus Bathyarchaeota archaeon]|nr:thioredoxin domain-containing protein [Candidatus Bathyarchaeota archaeon]